MPAELIVSVADSQLLNMGKREICYQADLPEEISWKVSPVSYKCCSAFGISLQRPPHNLETSSGAHGSFIPPHTLAACSRT